MFEKHLLAFVDLIHALQTRGGKYPIHVPRGTLHQGKNKLGEMHLSRGRLHSCIWDVFGSSFRLNFSCALLPMVSSPFAAP
jgi:hypothetical protein